MSGTDLGDGAPTPLGATWLAAESAWNFAVHSKDARSVTLLLYGANDSVRPVTTVELEPLVNKTGRVWHVRAAAARGTYAGLIEKIPYLVSLGVTAVELLPVQQYDTGGGNYWGYMTLHFFSPHLGYSVTPGDPERAMDEFRSMVKALHAAKIEV